MQTLLIDNYDSYTFNLYQLIAEVNGRSPLVIRNDQVVWSDLVELEFDNVVISPGPGNPSYPKNFGICARVIQDLGKPILGVCLGHQGIGYGFGGEVIHAPEVYHGRLSQVYHQERGLFAKVPSPFTVVRYHSLLVDRATLPNCLEIIAWTADDLIMGLRHRQRPIWGVQFHPESICTDYGHQILANFQAISVNWEHSKSVFKSRDLRSFAVQTIVPSRPTTGQSRPINSAFQVFTKKLDIRVNSEQVFSHFYGDQTYAFWLDSSQVETGLSRFSFMGDDQGRYSLLVKYNCERQIVEVTKNKQVTIKKDNIFNYLQEQLDRHFCTSEDLPFDFNCGFVGYFAYELKAECGGSFTHPSQGPDAVFIFATQMIVFDHQEQTIYLIYGGDREDREEAIAWFQRMETTLGKLQPLPKLKPLDHQEPIKFYWRRSRQTYLNDIAQCLQKIHDGESYEICLTNRLYTQTNIDPLAFYGHLRHQNPAPYAAFLRFGEVSIICSSPERFLKIDRQGWVETKPIKGTLHRGKTPEEDRQLCQDLGNSEKDRAENLMVVDLLRNDLGLVCDVGSVTVPKLMTVETYQTVHQLVSTIRGHLRSDLKVTDCIRAAFPGGSMTGAPKLRTMEIIDRLEGEARGIYSGSIGFLGLNGTADLNIVIRTAIVTPGETSIGVGGGIVAMSDPELEFAEILLKARALVDAFVYTVHGRITPELYRIIE